jgi:hypothetical protein
MAASGPRPAAGVPAPLAEKQRQRDAAKQELAAAEAAQAELATAHAAAQGEHERHEREVAAAADAVIAEESIRFYIDYARAELAYAFFDLRQADRRGGRIPWPRRGRRAGAARAAPCGWPTGGPHHHAADDSGVRRWRRVRLPGRLFYGRPVRLGGPRRSLKRRRRMAASGAIGGGGGATLKLGLVSLDNGSGWYTTAKIDRNIGRRRAIYVPREDVNLNVGKVPGRQRRVRDTGMGDG